jgi:hypothetical protein
MNIKRDYPDFAAIEKHIVRARAERSLVISHMLVDAFEAIGRGIRNFSATMGKGLAAERDRRAIEADSFLKRSVPKY